MGGGGHNFKAGHLLTFPLAEFEASANLRFGA